MSPTQIDAPNFNQGEIFNETRDNQLPVYFNILNEEGIEKKTFYQDDQSNIAEARSLLKALDRGDDEELGHKKSKLGTVRILDGLSDIPSAIPSDKNNKIFGTKQVKPVLISTKIDKTLSLQQSPN